MINKYCVCWVQRNFFLASSNAKRKRPHGENVIKTRSRCIASLACHNDDISIETVREIAYIAFARRFVRKIRSNYKRRTHEGGCERVCSPWPRADVLLFFPLSEIDEGRDLERNHFPRVWEGASGSPTGSAKYDDTHGAATRRYSTSGGRMVDVDLRASLREWILVTRWPICRYPPTGGKAGGCNRSSGAPGEIQVDLTMEM